VLARAVVKSLFIDSAAHVVALGVHTLTATLVRNLGIIVCTTKPLFIHVRAFIVHGQSFVHRVFRGTIVVFERRGQLFFRNGVWRQNLVVSSCLIWRLSNGNSISF